MLPQLLAVPGVVAGDDFLAVDFRLGIHAGAPDHADATVDDHRRGASDEIGLPDEVLTLRGPPIDQTGFIGHTGVGRATPGRPISGFARRSE